MLDERRSFEREMDALRRNWASGGVPEREIAGASGCIEWDKPGKGDIAGVSKGKLIDPETKKPSKVIAVLFEGQSTDVALVVGGVHGSEAKGVATAVALVATLRKEYSAAATRPKMSVLVVPNLFAKGVTASKEFGTVDGTREAPATGRGDVEPNRNFPRAGEGPSDVAKRKGKVLDPDQRRFTNKTPVEAASALKQATGFEADKLLPENRALTHVIGCLKPKRIATVHDHSAQAVPAGNEAGGFVDPRGGFDTAIDAPFTPEGRRDDASTGVLLAEALRQVRAIKDKDMRAHALERAFRGNLFDDARSTFGTVHYAFGAAKTRGTSLGMWGPAPIANGPDARDGIFTVTIENPQPNGKDAGLGTLTEKERQAIAEAWAAAIRKVFVEGL